MHMFIYLTYTYDIYYAISIRGRQRPYEFEGEWRGGAWEDLEATKGREKSN